MDHFERELARMMRDTQEHTPFEAGHQLRLRSGVRARRRTRLAQKAVGSVLAVAGLGIGLFLLPHDRVENRPQAPLPRPAISPASPSPAPSPEDSPSGTVAALPTGPAEETSVPPEAPSTTGSSDTPSPPPAAPTTSVPSTSGTPSPPATPSHTASTVGPPVSSATADPG
ncbi:hypothetical protein ABZ915_02950 [Streptomyces sp. NPDC046915]|uniref:hypothetical protein n=1 Tax=Streptomyces sp. NPDC046915 TaxID=3155257 RepID=UPI0033CE45C2